MLHRALQAVFSNAENSNVSRTEKSPRITMIVSLNYPQFSTSVHLMC